jgi:DNA-binding MarR family transcriptional regulator
MTVISRRSSSRVIYTADVTNRPPTDPGLDLSMLVGSLLNPLQDEVLVALSDAGHSKLRTCHGVVLAHLFQADARLTELAGLCGQPKQYIGRLVDELENWGYVSRTAVADDRRSKRITLTARGRAQQRDAHATLARIEKRYAAHLGERDYARFRQLLQRLATCEHDRVVEP